MNFIKDTLQEMQNKSIEFDITGMRPGEKIHEDMLAPTELPYTRVIDEKLLAVLPQYTKKNHNHNEVYDGLVMNSGLHLCEDTDLLKDLIARGLDDAD